MTHLRIIFEQNKQPVIHAAIYLCNPSFTGQHTKIMPYATLKHINPVSESTWPLQLRILLLLRVIICSNFISEQYIRHKFEVGFPKTVTSWYAFLSQAEGTYLKNYTANNINTVGSRFATVPFYDDSRLRPLSSRTQHSRLVAHHCPNSSGLSVLSALLALFQCAHVSSFSILVQFFQVDYDFSTHDVHQKDTKEEKIKTADVTFFLDVF